MQTEVTEIDPRGTADDIDFVHCDPVGDKLERLRSVFYHAVDARPTRDLTDFLPRQRRLVLPHNCSTTLDDGTTYHFCFVNQPHLLRTSVELMRDVLGNARSTECCMISAPKVQFALNGIKAAMLERRLHGLIERVPMPLGRIPDAIKNQLLIVAMKMEANHPLDVPAQVPFYFRQGIVDGKPVVLLLTSQFGEVHSVDSTTVAIPILADPKEGAIADPSPIFSFKFRGPQPKKSLSGVEVSQEEQSHLRSIAQNIVSEIHLTRAPPSHIRWALALLSKMYGIPLLFRQGGNPKYAIMYGSPDEDIAQLDEVTGTITPTARTTMLAPFLSAIETAPGTVEGRIVMQRINSRFLHTKDLVLAWGSGADASDMYRLHDEDWPEGPQTHCMCSETQAAREYHGCLDCGALAACKHFHMATFNCDVFRLCSS